MATFKNIVNKIINIDNNVFSSKYDKTDTVDLILKVYFAMLANNYNGKSKFVVFKEATEGPFLKLRYYEFLYYFYKIQKIYSALNRFAYICKYKRITTTVETDMLLNKLHVSDKNVINIYDNNCSYLFNINELVKIIETSLTNSVSFFSEPLPIKNPYSNVPFKKSTLYNIYYFLKYKTNNYSDLFHKFFISNFNMSIFFNNYEHLLREHSIKNYVSTSPNCILRSEIIKMLKVFNLSREEKYKIIIDKEFPDNLLIKIMRPYLLLYFKQLYSLIPIVKENAKCELKHKLYLFNKEYPMFGKRKILTSQKLLPNFKSRLYVSGVEFLSEHKPFQNETLSSFLSDHLEVDENHYYEDENNEFILNNAGNNINNINNINNLIMQNEYYFEDEDELVYEDDDDNSIS